MCNSNDVYILVKVTITVPNTAAAKPDPNNKKWKEIFKKCGPFVDCISKINSTLLVNAKGIDVVMSMYKLIEYNDIYSKTSRSLWKLIL